ncbi:MAG: FAD-binding oxidoreductase [Rhodobacteraceae bacterium]|nr:FAD-binding oxidoreductase [Paracoccaceae bacterium]
MSWQTPERKSYDIVIIGGAVMGSSTAFWLRKLGFDGSVLVVEMDPSYENTSTARTNSCIRQQFTNPLNVQISQFSAHFIKNAAEEMGDERVPDIHFQPYGYMYLAGDASRADDLRERAKLQRDMGAATEVLNPEELAQRYPFYNLEDIAVGTINLRDEGYFDGGTLFEWMRRLARERGVEYCTNKAVGITKDGQRVTKVELASGEEIACGQVLNAAGPRAATVASMVGIELPVEPRKRYTWIFSAEEPLDRELPLTIDPSGVHVRQDGPQTYLAGATPEIDPAVDPMDFTMTDDTWIEKAWPAIAHRIPAFERIRIISEWAGHYEYNTFDHNALLGSHPDAENMTFINGFSGHGLQQSVSMGRGTAEWLMHGSYQSLDLSPFAVTRVAEGRKFIEQAVI